MNSSVLCNKTSVFTLSVEFLTEEVVLSLGCDCAREGNSLDCSGGENAEDDETILSKKLVLFTTMGSLSLWYVLVISSSSTSLGLSFSITGVSPVTKARHRQ